MTGSLQIKNGKYYLVLHHTGKYKWISTGLDVKGNKRRAEALLQEALDKYKHEPESFSNDIFFTDYLQQWLETVRHSIRPNTYAAYGINILRHIVPYFEPKHLRLRDITPAHLQVYYNAKIEGGLSPNTVIKHHTNIHKALKYACALMLITHNPSDNVMLPGKIKPSFSFYDMEQLAELFEAVRGTPIEAAVRLSAVYGLRRSEVLGLRWRAVDFKNNTLTINHTAVLVRNEIHYNDTVKTKASHRTFPLIDDIGSYLLELKSKRSAAKEVFGESYLDSEYICTWEDGEPIKPAYLSTRFSKILKKVGLPHIRFHDLRHSAASLLLDMGFSLREIQEWLGHGDIGTTANIYTHLQYKAKIGMAEQLGKKFAAGMSSRKTN